ncbi:MAG: hypothetical protein KF894_30030 [Labilithrix sp.]|nr:hypothetical protein [Labilithrix sp.]
MELTHHVRGEALAAAVGALLGVAIFVAAVALVSRRRSALGLAVLPATELAFVPPAPGAAPARSWPSPSGMRGAPEHPMVASSALVVTADVSRSTERVAAAFAKMGFAFGERLEPTPRASASEASAVETGPASAVTVHPIISVEAAPASRRESSPPAPVVRRGPRSGMLAAAPIAELDLDDGPTELGEPFFDVDSGLPAPIVRAPEPCRRGAAPRIRPVAPAAPRASRHP